MKAQSIDPTFHEALPERLSHWVYAFLNRQGLSIRRPTRKGQKLSNHLKEIRDDFVRSLQDRFSVFGTVADVPWSRVVNMDETPVYFEPDVHTTIAPKGAKTVSARVCSTQNPRVSVCLAVTATREKLPPFVVFKGVPGARVNAEINRVMPAKMFGTCQTKAWLDDPTTEAWRDSVWAPFASGGPPSVLLMDDYKCHKQPAFTKSFAKLGTEVEILPGNALNLCCNGCCIVTVLYYCML
ncbi:hypothetical protein DYB31_008874 [Aphanomyces astaci]|uniref:DDE-1 domain-containing protein n=1 Tax=Aphanomyces astaci TaxID=112090 RepID=A0A397G0Z4_APHAT|nr:hypothetical protein DYB31_008874 [Aphanomyces astaci]